MHEQALTLGALRGGGDDVPEFVGSQEVAAVGGEGGGGHLFGHLAADRQGRERDAFG